jgi:antitoxin ParD1/3/4
LLVGALESTRRLIYIGRMNIKLPREQSDWLQTQVDAGHFSSVDDAVTMAVADFMAAGNDGLAWAKPYVDEARAAVARGEVVSADDAMTDIDAHMAALKR